MGYQMPIVCKTLVLPIDQTDNTISLKQYREKYGIDLKKYIRLDLDAKTIIVEFKDEFVLIKDSTPVLDYGARVFNPIVKVESAYNVGAETDAVTNLFNVESGNVFGITLTMSYDDTFEIDNLMISEYNI